MGLIARALEAEGIVTTSISAARDITVAGRLPRAVFVDYPHGHTAGRLEDSVAGRTILEAAFGLLSNNHPEQLVDLDLRWAETDVWKDDVFMPQTDSSGEAGMIDDRTERHESPQYQSESDAGAARESHDGHDCLVCVGIDL